MNIIREIVLDWLFNASVQIGIFAVLAAILAPFIAKIKAKNQHHLYLAVFALCVSAPVFNTLYRTRPIADANSPHLQLIKEREHPELPLWSWNWRSGEGTSVMLAPGTKTALLVIWQLLFLYQLIQFIRGIYRVHRVRRDALSLAPSTIGMDGSIMELPSPVAILESKAIDDPVTVGALHAAIILPSKVISSLDATDFKAILARAVSLQETSAFANTAPAYAGTWHWMFRGKSFATMMLVQNGSGFTGSVTGSKIALDDDGELSRADPSDDNTPSEISKAKLEQNGLRITVGDGS